MGLRYPNQLDPHPVLGRWTPDSLLAQADYRVWGLLGLVVVAIAYPFVLLGLATRLYGSRVLRAVNWLGVLGVVAVGGVLWGGLTALAYVRFSADGFYAVAAAVVVAALNAVLAFASLRIAGRKTTILAAYPFAINAICLPVVVAALYSPTLANTVFPSTTSLAAWLLDTVFSVGGLAAAIRERFRLEGVAFVGLWFAIDVLVGWLLGVAVTAANAVRPN